MPQQMTPEQREKWTKAALENNNRRYDACKTILSKFIKDDADMKNMYATSYGFSIGQNATDPDETAARLSWELTKRDIAHIIDNVKRTVRVKVKYSKSNLDKLESYAQES